MLTEDRPEIYIGSARLGCMRCSIGDRTADSFQVLTGDSILPRTHNAHQQLVTSAACNLRCF
jgi:hypothetical protein